jgi:hypothetical protein
VYEDDRSGENFIFALALPVILMGRITSGSFLGNLHIAHPDL